MMRSISQFGNFTKWIILDITDTNEPGAGAPGRPVCM